MKNLVRRQTKWVEFMYYPDVYEENFTHLEYEEDPLDMLPCWEPKSRSRDRHYRRWDEYSKKAENVVNASHGWHISTLYRRVKEALKWTGAYRGREWDFIKRRLDTYERDSQGNVHLKDMNGPYKTRRGYYGWKRGILVENEMGYIDKYFQGQKPKTSPRNWRKHYQLLTLRRRNNKERVKDYQRMGNFYLKLINEPRLYDFYKKIVEEYRGLNELEKKSHEDPPRRDKKDSDKEWRWRLYWWKYETEQFTLTKRRRRDKIRQDLDDMMRGDYGSFYSSKEYLWSLYKECHHFSGH